MRRHPPVPPPKPNKKNILLLVRPIATKPSCLLRN